MDMAQGEEIKTGPAVHFHWLCDIKHHQRGTAASQYVFKLYTQVSQCCFGGFLEMSLNQNSCESILNCRSRRFHSRVYAAGNLSRSDGRDEHMAQFFCLIYIVPAAFLMLSTFAIPVWN